MKYIIYNATQKTFLANPFSAIHKNNKKQISLMSISWRTDLNELCLMDERSAKVILNLIQAKYKKIQREDKINILETLIDYEGKLQKGNELCESS